MKKTNRTITAGLIVLSLLVSGPSLLADDKPVSAKAREKKESKAGGDEDPAPAPEVRGLDLLPVGKTNKGVRLPLYEKKTGDLKLVFNIGELTPMDKEKKNLDMVALLVEVLGKAKDGSEDLKIELIDANYNTPRGIISTDKKAVITRPDLILEGETLDYDTRRSVGRMTGRTKMTIYNFKRLQSDGVQSTGAGEKKENEDENREKPPLPRLNIR